MKIVLQRVLNASLTIENKEYSKIDKGYLLLVSFTDGDNELIASKLATKVANLRVFEDMNGKTNLSLKDVNGEILSVSQFTLYANLKKGNRPSFIECLNPGDATLLYEYFNKELETHGFNVKRGVFGADMKINLTNDGPFTVIIDSKEIL